MESPANEDASDIDTLFVIDSSPGPVKDDLEIPTYEKKFSDVLQAQNPVKTTSAPKRPRPPQTVCWNCEGEHAVRDCPEQRDPFAISRNRAKYMSSKQSTPRGGRSSRYHQDDEQKFPHNHPGRISSRLRRALGLKSNQLPRHIYRMRSLGYPPGWVEEARVSHSGLFLFNSAGEEVADPGFEDGEITPAGAKDKFDVRKIIEYPGFNCLSTFDFIDETERLNARPMSEIDSIDRLISIWQPRAVRAYKRKKMLSEDTNATPPSHLSVNIKQTTLNTAEKGLDSEEDGEISNDTDETAHYKEGGSSPSTSQPEKILKRNISPICDSADIKRCKLQEETSCTLNTNNTTPENGTKKVEFKQENSGTPEKFSLGRVKSLSLGTPVIVQSQYSNLPTPEKFSKNICDVINFENLPDSTGKYEKMSGLLKKVRVTVSKMFDDSEESA